MGIGKTFWVECIAIPGDQKRGASTPRTKTCSWGPRTWGTRLKGNCRSFAYRPQTEVRLGPRALWMTVHPTRLRRVDGFWGFWVGFAGVETPASLLVGTSRIGFAVVIVTRLGGCGSGIVPSADAFKLVEQVATKWGLGKRSGLSALLSQVTKSEAPPPQGSRPILGDPGTWGTRHLAFEVSLRFSRNGQRGFDAHSSR